MTAARFRLPRDTSPEAKQERVDALIQELGLIKAKDTKIGDEKYRGVSGGERKRTNIGVELIKDPSLLFLDEPTYDKKNVLDLEIFQTVVVLPINKNKCRSGLDSFQALNVVEALKH